MDGELGVTERSLELPNRYQRYNQSPKGLARTAAYEATDKARGRRTADHTRRREATLERYLSRPFVSWDGEGGNYRREHVYFLLASSNGDELVDREGIGTARIFSMLIAQPKGPVHIGYGLNYDVNMWIKDMDRETLETLYHEGACKWEGYWIEWRAGKSFTIRRRDQSFTIYDVLPFFQCSFVKACDEYLGTEWESREEIINEKSRRNAFTFAQLDTIRHYNRAELANLIRLADELKQRLYRVDIRVKRWDGPGAIAASLYQKYKTKQALGVPPDEVTKAGRHAYAGGRFEIIRKGHSMEKAYQYDIRSAYPSAMRDLPCCNPSHGQWRHTIDPVRSVAKFGMYRIETDPEWSPETLTRPQPLWMRDSHGAVIFTDTPSGWYWSPEAQLSQEINRHVYEIKEAWEWVQRCDCDPFGFVEPLYNKRAALKRANDGAHVGLKLGLNSLYGKLAQQIGFDPGPPLRLPPYHSLEWAGYITSHCRAQVYRAAMLSIDDVIAFETDAIFSRVPLDLDIGSRLGEWDCTIYDSLTYLKSGMYYGTLSADDSGQTREVEKSRGINKGSITRKQAIKALSNCVTISAKQTRFVGLGVALNQDFSKWRKWYTDPRIIKTSLFGKRWDIYDSDDLWAMKDDGWNETTVGYCDVEFSVPYPVEWVNDETTIADPTGLGIDEVRLSTAHETEWIEII